MKVKYLIVLSAILIFQVVGCSKVESTNQTTLETVKEDVDETVEQTRYVYEEPSLETNEVFNETYAYVDSVYTETEAYVSRYPDYDLPDIDGYEKDAYGNYVITEDMFSEKYLPLNDDGVIEYISYFDSNGIMVNPMPHYYNDYLQYFAVDGG
ncbi:TPA: hypothetical protein KOR75_001132 [Clostridioides difficile]|nr:hypothetical protein [Clostridioides difficile]